MFTKGVPDIVLSDIVLRFTVVHKALQHDDDPRRLFSILCTICKVAKLLKSLNQSINWVYSLIEQNKENCTT